MYLLIGCELKSSFWICLHLVIFSLIHSQNNLQPIKNWAEYPATVNSSFGHKNLNELKKGKQSTLQFPSRSQEPWISWSHKPGESSMMLVTYSVSEFTTGVLEMALDSVPGMWMTLEEFKPGPFLNKLEYRTSLNTTYRLRFHKLAGRKLKVWNIGLYRISEKGKNDYWLTLGASLQNQSMRQACFAPKVRALFPQANPIMFNLAVKGWNAENLLKNLPFILEHHPHATYVMIHIGGNDISTNRPFPGGIVPLRHTLTRILKTIQDAGKIPILARPSFRLYPTWPIVPPESNGSGPYASQVYDPLIEQYSPYFFDFSTGKGRVDKYNLLKKDPNLLSDDGVHLNLKGELSWCEDWAISAGSIVYGKGPAVEYIGATTLFSNRGADRNILFKFQNLDAVPDGSSIKIYNPRTRKSFFIRDFSNHKNDVFACDYSLLIRSIEANSNLNYLISIGKKKYRGNILTIH